MIDDYSNHPPSVAEVRSDRSQAAEDWTPRDALIAVLRMLDAGKIKPAALAVVWVDGPEMTTSYRIASPSATLTQGMLHFTAQTCLIPTD